MLTGLSFLFVGAVLSLNGIWMLGRIGEREIAVINGVVAAITIAVASALAFGQEATLESVKAAALTLLFSTTYLWVAINRIAGFDGRGLGWFSLFVAITVTPVAWEAWTAAQTPFAHWIALCWAAWAVLWFLYFLLLALACPILRATAWFTLFCGVFTAWLPGWLMLNGWG
ncbi:AmiS/UreI family transporter [Pseudorhodobacter sp.]|uniref:AmiS/UreI family transporter n=1 Tax=Pseudorhodobacter sp. TaxID=1934400 RepID=UPI0026482A4A|nr:AmiS/UreI family transporter [Pseudorhodobacter sp.]MDN5786853.1 transporter [Pseudorhodobacter sp.]